MDTSKFKLGKLPAKHDTRTLKMKNYLSPSLAPPPPTYDLTAKITDIGMMLNNILGNCVIASGGHSIQAWTAEAGKQIILPDAVIQSTYSAVTGYDPSQTQPNGYNPTDQGTVVLDFLNYWRQTGIAGHKIGAYAAFNPANEIEFKQAIYYFEAAFLGVMLPLAWQDAPAWTGVPNSDPNSQPGSWGGHGIPAVRYTEPKTSVISWGGYIDLDFDSAAVYCDEAYALISVDQLDGTGKTPGGIDWIQLQADLAIVTA